MAIKTYESIQISGTLYRSTDTPATGDLAVMFPKKSTESALAYLLWVLNTNDLY